MTGPLAQLTVSDVGILLCLIAESDLELGSSEAEAPFSGYLLRLAHSESCRTLAALLERRHSGAGWWEAAAWHAMKPLLCAQESF